MTTVPGPVLPVPALLAAAAAAVAVAAALPTGPRSGRPGAPRASAGWGPASVPRARLEGAAAVAALAAAVAAAVVAAVVVGLPVLPVLVACGATVAVRALRRRSRLRAAARERSERVLALSEQLTADLAAGRPLGPALRVAARDWPELGAAVRALDLGGDPVAGPVAALRAAGREPGAGGLCALAAGLEVSARLGAPVAAVLEQVTDGLRADAATDRLVEGELASARATARLVALLPLAALLLGRGTGADPLAFLLSTGAGGACLALGVALGLLGVAWIDLLAARAGSAS